MQITERLFKLAWHDVGLLLLRVGLGLSIMTHGIPKLQGGPERWYKLGGVMSSFGIDFAHTFWGFCAAFSEGIGGLLLAIGLAARPSALALSFTMFVAAFMHLSNGDGYGSAGHAVELCVVFFALLLTGPGRYSIDKHFR